ASTAGAADATPGSASATDDGATAPPPQPATATATATATDDPAATAAPAPALPATATPTSTTPAASADTAETFSLQIGAFSSQANAQVQVGKVSQLGLDPYVVLVIDGDRTLYTVRLGRYSSRDAAQSAAAALREESGLSAVIRGLPAGS
ncbi:MAG: SPOR domain-containing protein, partial [Acidobacteriota bacterium]